MKQLKVPSQVWIGEAQVLKKAAIGFLQKQFCDTGSEQACQRCLVCQQIENEQYYNILWLAPDGQYKVEQIREVLARLALRLAQTEQFYFVFLNAHCLNEASANSLLKSIEEPPAGYNFLFLTPRKELLLPTVLSRSLIKQFESQDDVVAHDILSCFTSQKLNPVEFNAMLEHHRDLTEQDSRTLLDQIYGYWLHQAKKGSAADELAKIKRVIAVLQQAQDVPPMPGSSKLFWRNLYLQLAP